MSCNLTGAVEIYLLNAMIVFISIPSKMNELNHLLFIDAANQVLVLRALFAVRLLDELLQFLPLFKVLHFLTMSRPRFRANDYVSVDMKKSEISLDYLGLWFSLFENLPSLQSFQGVVNILTLFQKCRSISSDNLLPSNSLQKG